MYKQPPGYRRKAPRIKPQAERCAGVTARSVRCFRIVYDGSGLCNSHQAQREELVRHGLLDRDKKRIEDWQETNPMFEDKDV